MHFTLIASALAAVAFAAPNGGGYGNHYPPTYTTPYGGGGGGYGNHNPPVPTTTTPVVKPPPTCVNQNASPQCCDSLEDRALGLIGVGCLDLGLVGGSCGSRTLACCNTQNTGISVIQICVPIQP